VVAVTDFVLNRTEHGDHGTIYHATITVSSGHLWWKKSAEIDIFRARTDNWRRSDNGAYVRHPDVVNLARVWTMKHGDEC